MNDFVEYSCNITTIPPSEENIELISEIVSVQLEAGNLEGFTVNTNATITFGSKSVLL